MSTERCPHCRYTTQLSSCAFCHERWRGCLKCYWTKHRMTHAESKEIDDMAIIVKDSGHGDFKPAPTGAHAARCCDVRDLGYVKARDFSGKEFESHKLLVSWLIAELRDDGKPFLVSKRYTASLHEKAALRKDLESWRGRAFTAAELDGFDVEKLIGVPAMLNVVHNEDKGKTYANVSAVMPLPKAMAKEAPSLEGFVRFIDRKADEEAPAHTDADQPVNVEEDEVPF